MGSGTHAQATRSQRGAPDDPSIPSRAIRGGWGRSLMQRLVHTSNALASVRRGASWRDVCARARTGKGVVNNLTRTQHARHTGHTDAWLECKKTWRRVPRGVSGAAWRERRGWRGSRCGAEVLRSLGRRYAALGGSSRAGFGMDRYA